ncbi:MAG: MBL fold metallo-hydrolase [Dehalococcoidales bacterium]|nr:MBL fold metallo-hydrolase [Dehalococcoidales bacterium]
MKIKWLGHASFLITSVAGTRIITDPFTPGGELSYGKITESADIVTVSHEHNDHNDTSSIPGNPRVVRSSAEIKGIKIKAIPAYHDDAQGKKRGSNIIFCFDIDGIRICHAGDLGQELSEKQRAEIGKVDILLVPAGGFYTMEVPAANKVCDQLKPAVIIPMHFKTPKCHYPIAPVDEFLKGKVNIVLADGSEIEFRAGALPEKTQIIVLKPAL